MKRKEHEKRMKKAAIKVFFKDGKVDILPSKIWDDYKYIDGMFVVKRRGVWIVVYNMESVTCISVG